MARAPSPRVKSRASRLRAALALFACAWSCAGPVRADVVLVPSADGFVGAFLALGPLGAATPIGDRLMGLEPRFGNASPLPGSWRLVSKGEGALDLGAELGARHAGARALLGGTLILPTPFDGYLLLSVDGSVTVHVNGRQLWSRTERRLRAGSWDVVPMTLAAGQHQVLLVLQHPGAHWAVETRWLARTDLRPPAGARWVLEGTPAALEKQLPQALLRSRLTTRLDAAGLMPFVEVGAPRGASLPADLGVRVQIGSARAAPRELRLGSLAINAHGIHPLRASLPSLTPDDLSPGTGHLDLSVLVGDTRMRHRLAIDRRTLELVQRALQQGRLLDQSSLPALARSVLQASLDWHLRELTHACQSGESTLLNRSATELEGLLDQMRSDERFLFAPGIHQLAHFSELDGQPQAFWLHVPQGFDAESSRRYPAVLALHGYDGSPRGITQAFLDSTSRKPRPAVDGFVIAPEAHGNAFYRGPGEYETMAVLELVRRLYPVDDARISVTGVSMGGTGAAQLALRYADTFAAAAPLCGYHSYFIRRDTLGRPIQPWESVRMQHWSNASWSENGRHLPLFVAHGTRDRPLENSRVLIQTYQEHGYSVEQEWPDTGHAVWNVSYRGARLWPWLTRHTRPSFPERVTISTDSLRYGKRFWAEIQQLQEFGKRARLDAEFIDPNTIAVSSDNVQRFQLHPRATGSRRLSVLIDQETLDFDGATPVTLHRERRWRAGTASPAALEKRPGIEGPIRDVFLGPVTFVYGSLDRATWRANLEVAERFGRYHSGVTLGYPVVADREVTAELAARHSLVLVGTQQDNSVLARLTPRLPIRAEGAGIRAGSRSFFGTDIGAVFVHPNPEHPERYVVVITAPQITGILRALSLPHLLPDFMIYDVDLRAAAGQQLLGAASVKAAGYFGSSWSLPASLTSSGPP